MNFEVVVTESAGHTDGGQHPRLENKLVRLFLFFLKHLASQPELGSSSLEEDPA